MSTIGNGPRSTPANRAEGPEGIWMQDELDVSLVLSDDLRVPVSATFSYGTSDPYSVHVVFHVVAQDPVYWVFGRELLTAGMTRMAGQADVVVWQDGDRGVVCLLLESHDGHALLEAEVPAVAHWLERTYLLVPAGREGQFCDIDAGLERLLDSAEQ